MDRSSIRTGDVPMIPASSLVREALDDADVPQTYRGQVRQARLQREREATEQRLRETRNEVRSNVVQSRREQAEIQAEEARRRQALSQINTPQAEGSEEAERQALAQQQAEAARAQAEATQRMARAEELQRQAFAMAEAQAQEARRRQASMEVAPVQSTVSVLPAVPSNGSSSMVHESAQQAQRGRALGTMAVYGEAQKASADQPPPIVVPAVTVSTYNERLHLRRVMRVVAESCPADPLTGQRRWLGLKTFLNYYFASNLKLFLGRKSVVRVFLITTEHDLCGRLYRMDGNRYVLSLVANFDYWDQLLGIACALPDVYFSGSGTRDTARTYLRQMRGGASYGEHVGQRVDAEMLNFYDTSPKKCNDDAEDTNDWPVDQAIAALCIAHLFETIIRQDLQHKLPQYITLAQLFTRDPAAVNPFKVELCCR